MMTKVGYGYGYGLSPYGTMPYGGGIAIPSGPVRGGYIWSRYLYYGAPAGGGYLHYGAPGAEPGGDLYEGAPGGGYLYYGAPGAEPGGGDLYQGEPGDPRQLGA